HMEGDMMHDALRADVLVALRAIAHGASLDEARADLTDHAQAFRNALVANQALPLSADIIAALADIKPKIDGYIGAAEALLTQAASDPAAAEAAFPAFLARFKELEGAMDAVSSRIEASASDAATAAEHGADVNRSFIAGAAGLTLLLL